MEQNIYLDKESLEKAKNLVLELGASIDINSLKEEEKEIEKETFQPGFWDDSQAAQKLIKKQNQYKEKIDTYDHLMADIEEAEVMIDLMEEEEDFSFYDQFKEAVKNIRDRAANFKLTTLPRRGIRRQCSHCLHPCRSRRNGSPRLGRHALPDVPSLWR